MEECSIHAVVVVSMADDKEVREEEKVEGKVVREEEKVVGMDKLNTHKRASLDEAFPPQQERQ